MSNTLFAFVALAFLAATPVAAHQSPDLAPYFIADHSAEVALARSAAPKSISEAATVLVMTRKGYAEAAHGRNGFTCLVFRSFAGTLTDPNFWNAKVRAPACFNPPATKTLLPQALKRAEWIMAGVSPTEIGARTKTAYASHEFLMPAAGAMAYMISHQQILDASPHWLPHLMFFYDRSQPAAAWGAIEPNTTILNGSAGDEQNPVMTLLIPVRRWSDGTPAAADKGR